MKRDGSLKGPMKRSNRLVGWALHAALSVALTLLPACGTQRTPQAQAPVRVAAIRLSRVTILAVFPADHEACDRSVRDALRRHGLEPGASGTPVEIELVLWETPIMGAPPRHAQGADSLFRQALPRVGHTADLNATIDAPEGEVSVLATGYSEAMGAKGACVVAAERLAKEMARSLGPLLRDTQEMIVLSAVGR